MITSSTLISLSLFAALHSALLMHPVHETVCEVQWNSQTSRVEVALRVDALDEQWIAKQTAVDTEADWQGDFLRTQIHFDPVIDGSSKPSLTGRPIKWVGRKEDGGHVWWFFEVVCKDGKPPTSVQSRLLFDRHPGYRHRIVVLGDSEAGNADRDPVVLTERKPKATLLFR